MGGVVVWRGAGGGEDLEPLAEVLSFLLSGEQAGLGLPLGIAQGKPIYVLRRGGRVFLEVHMHGQPWSCGPMALPQTPTQVHSRRLPSPRVPWAGQPKCRIPLSPAAWGTQVCILALLLVSHVASVQGQSLSLLTYIMASTATVPASHPQPPPLRVYRRKAVHHSHTS